MRVRSMGMDAISTQIVKEPRVEELQSIAIGSWLRMMNFFVFGPWCEFDQADEGCNVRREVEYEKE